MEAIRYKVLFTINSNGDSSMTILLNGSTADTEVALDALADTTANADITFKLPTASNLDWVLQTDGSQFVQQLTITRLVKLKL